MRKRYRRWSGRGIDPAGCTGKRALDGRRSRSRSRILLLLPPICLSMRTRRLPSTRLWPPHLPSARLSRRTSLMLLLLVLRMLLVLLGLIRLMLLLLLNHCKGLTRPLSEIPQGILHLLYHLGFDFPFLDPLHGIFSSRQHARVGDTLLFDIFRIAQLLNHG